MQHIYSGNGTVSVVYVIHKDTHYRTKYIKKILLSSWILSSCFCVSKFAALLQTLWWTRGPIVCSSFFPCILDDLSIVPKMAWLFPHEGINRDFELIPECDCETHQSSKGFTWKFANKGPSSQGYGFSSGYVWMWELDCEQSWAPKNWCLWTVVLEKTLESVLDCKEIQPGHSEGDKPWDFFGRNDAKAETPVLWPPHGKSWLIGKDSDAGRDWGREEKGTTEDEMAGWHHRLSGHEFEWTPGVGDGQRGLACCDSWGCKESDMTERLNWTEINFNFKTTFKQFWICTHTLCSVVCICAQ